MCQACICLYILSDLIPTCLSTMKDSDGGSNAYCQRTRNTRAASQAAPWMTHITSKVDPKELCLVLWFFEPCPQCLNTVLKTHFLERGWQSTLSLTLMPVPSWIVFVGIASPNWCRKKSWPSGVPRGPTRTNCWRCFLLVAMTEMLTTISIVDGWQHSFVFGNVPRSSKGPCHARFVMAYGSGNARKKSGRKQTFKERSSLSPTMCRILQTSVVNAFAMFALSKN